jgi:hypothetical protein
MRPQRWNLGLLRTLPGRARGGRRSACGYPYPGPTPATPQSARRYPRRHLPVHRPGEPSPGLAALLGFIPGVGAMYNEQYAKGIVHLMVFACWSR